MDKQTWKERFLKGSLAGHDLQAYVMKYRRWRMLGSAMFFLALLSFVFSTQSQAPAVGDHIAKVRLTLSPYTTSVDFISQLQNAFSNPASKGVLLYFDQAVVDDHDYAKVEAALDILDRYRGRKPSAAFIFGYALGGNYVMASGADRVVSQETASVGGLSVSQGRFDPKQLLEKVGVEVVTKGFGNLKTEPGEESEYHDQFIEHRQELYQHLHEWMVRKVSSYRKLSAKDFANVIDGQWYMGVRAKEVGLSDSLGDERTALDWLDYKIGEELPVLDYIAPEYDSPTSWFGANMWKSQVNKWTQSLLNVFWVSVEDSVNYSVDRITHRLLTRQVIA